MAKVILVKKIKDQGKCSSTTTACLRNDRTVNPSTDVRSAGASTYMHWTLFKKSKADMQPTHHDACSSSPPHAHHLMPVYSLLLATSNAGCKVCLTRVSETSFHIDRRPKLKLKPASRRNHSKQKGPAQRSPPTANSLQIVKRRPRGKPRECLRPSID